MAAVLACGPNAVLSHRSAVALHGLRPDNRAKTDVTLPSSSAKSRPGIDVPRSSTLSPADVTTVAGIPCMTVARTLVDLGHDVDRRGVERALGQAEVLQVFDGGLSRTRPSAPGPAAVPEFSVRCSRTSRSPRSQSAISKRFLALCRSASLPSPAVNAWITVDDGFAHEADFLWRA
jgi:hypothetical protein